MNKLRDHLRYWTYGHINLLIKILAAASIIIVAFIVVILCLAFC